MIAMGFSIITNILFIPIEEDTLFAALICFLVHRIVLLTYTLKLLQIKDYIPVVIAAVPFVLLFFYMQGISDIPPKLVIITALQNILISFLAGIAIANFMLQDPNRNAWLFISVLLFIGLQVVVFLERFYLNGDAIPALRPLAMGINAFAFYTFYEFIISAERSEADQTPVG
jgi:hypothetical protein